MSVVFESTIKVDATGNWYIELVDTMDGRVALCRTLDEYSQKIEDFGSDYGGQIEDVRWNKDANVSEQVMNEIRIEMAIHQAEIKEKQGDTF